MPTGTPITYMPTGTPVTSMPTGSPVVTVGINKAANAAIYALKILANENSTIRRKLKNHKFEQHSSVIKESDELKKLGLSKFVKKNVKICEKKCQNL